MKAPPLGNLRSAWARRSPRERWLLRAAALVLAAALGWTWGLAPALSTWRMAPQKQAELDRQTEQMLLLLAQAGPLQPTARLSRQEAITWLERSAGAQLGEDTRLQLQGDQLRVLLKGTLAGPLAHWLSQAREQAQALPISARLQREKTAPTPGAPAPEARWNGELTLRLP